MDINIMESNLSKSIKRQNIDSTKMVENQSNSIQKKEKLAKEIIMPMVVLPIPMEKDQLQLIDTHTETAKIEDHYEKLELLQKEKDTHIDEKARQLMYVENLCDSVKTALNQSSIQFNPNSTLGKLITENISQGNTIEDILSDSIEKTTQKKGLKKESGYPVTIRFKDGSVALALINQKHKKGKSEKSDYEVHGQSINNKVIRNIINSQDVSLIKDEGKISPNNEYIKKNRQIIKDYFGNMYLRQLDSIDKEEKELKELQYGAQSMQEDCLEDIFKLQKKGHTDESPEIKVLNKLLKIKKNEEIEMGVKLLNCESRRSEVFQNLQKIQDENEYYADLLCSELNDNSITFEEGSRLNKSLKGQKVKNVQFLSSYYHRKRNFLYHDSKNQKQGCPVLITLENGKSIKVLMNIKDKNSFEVY